MDVVEFPLLCSQDRKYQDLCKFEPVSDIEIGGQGETHSISNASELVKEGGLENVTTLVGLLFQMTIQ